ncbi:MAG: DUF1573 domain-containing protein [Planctomycetaceae bacterium]|nr:DUF1573 domain-containing protein [Planctomycetaceae bacterium]
MFRKVSLVLGLFVLVQSACLGQEWAQKMFKEADHDFGSVARGAKAEYRFVFENLYLEDVHIADVRSSCGCTTPIVETPLLKTYQKGSILAHFNTDTFQGQRSATLTIVIDRPFPAEVQVQVHGYIRGDVVVDPGSVQLGSIDQGNGADQSVAVNYAGRDDWQITEIKTSNSYISAKAVQTARENGQVSYALQVHVDKNAPAGYLNDHLMLVTNDGSAQIPVLVEGRVVAGITVSPASLFMGVVEPGQKVTKQLVVKGKKPFRILSISCDDKSFKFDTSKENAAKALHMIPVTFSAGADAGKVVKTIRIKTDQGEMSPELAAYAVVTPAH